MNYYQAHGLLIQSDIHFPGLLKINPQELNHYPGEKVKISLIEEYDPDLEILSEGIFRVATQYQITRNSIQLLWDNEFLCAIKNGEEIQINKHSSLPKNFLYSLIQGAALGVLLHQKGCLVLHASAVNIDGSGVAFTGHNRMGKSTTTMAFINQGYPLIADDILSIRILNGTPQVFSGNPYLKLWPEVIRKFPGNCKSLHLIHPESTKKACILKSSSLGSFTLKKIYVLEKNTQMSISEISPGESLMELIRNSYCANIFQESDEEKYFREYAALLSTVPLKKLERFDSLKRLPELVKLVEDDLK